MFFHEYSWVPYRCHNVFSLGAVWVILGNKPSSSCLEIALSWLKKENKNAKHAWKTDFIILKSGYYYIYGTLFKIINWITLCVVQQLYRNHTPIMPKPGILTLFSMENFIKWFYAIHFETHPTVTRCKNYESKSNQTHKFTDTTLPLQSWPTMFQLGIHNKIDLHVDINITTISKAALFHKP